VGIKSEVYGVRMNFVTICSNELKLPVAVASPSKGEILFNCCSSGMSLYSPFNTLPKNLVAIPMASDIVGSSLYKAFGGNCCKISEVYSKIMLYIAGF